MIIAKASFFFGGGGGGWRPEGKTVEASCRNSWANNLSIVSYPFLLCFILLLPIICPSRQWSDAKVGFFKLRDWDKGEVRLT